MALFSDALPLPDGGIAVALLCRTLGFLLTLTVAQLASSRSFDLSQRCFLARLLPHLARCVQIQLRLETAAGARAGCLAALDRLPLAVLLLDGAGRVVHVSQAAELLLLAGDGLALRDGRLVAGSPGESERLRRLTAACADGVPLARHPGGQMAISRPSCGRPWSVRVTPLPAAAAGATGERFAAMVQVREPGAVASVSGNHLMELYGLTGAEARVATTLLEVDSLRELATELKVKIATVRTHLHRLFDKTGTKRQVELVQLLTTLQKS
ncbi:MAG: helix-turn-helix transcriptional regulator [Geminicoccaceae bacterium]